MKLFGIKIPFSAITDSPLVLLGVSDDFLYEEGKKTDIVKGKKYVVGIQKDFEKVTIKVPASGATITSNDIANAKTPLIVSFADCIATPYRVNGDYELAFSASAISVVK